jgi:hypothetical protein
MQDYYIGYKNEYHKYVREIVDLFKVEVVVYDEVEHWREDKNDSNFDYPYMPRRSVINSIDLVIPMMGEEYDYNLEMLLFHRVEACMVSGIND